MGSLKTPLVYIARHGETVLNADGCFRGNKNVPLNDSGLKDAENLARYFEKIPLCYIVCSDRIRAVQTAKAIAKKKGVAIHPTENLRALNVGDFSGKPRDAKNVADLQMYLDSPDVPIPGGESLNDFKSRIAPCINEAVRIAQAEGKPILLVAHSSIVHEVGSLIFGDHHKILVDPGGIAVIYPENGQVTAAPIYRKAAQQANGRSDTVS
jgi:broad specificity phosphatase PhoE